MMGQLDEYQKDERAVVNPAAQELDAKQFWADAQVGKKVRELVRGGQPSNLRGIIEELNEFGSVEIAAAVWGYVCELLGEEGAHGR